MLNLTLIILILLMLTYIVTTEQNIWRYRKIMEDLPIGSEHAGAETY